MESQQQDQPWELYYWNNIKEDGRNHMIGRGEFVRLMFEVTGTPYIEVGKESPTKVFEMLDRSGKNPSTPLFAPPIIKKGDFTLSQTPAIMKYLGKKFGLYPSTEESEAQADSLICFVTDLIAEGRLVFHARCFTESYYTQQEETKGHVEWFKTNRLPMFLKFLEKSLIYNLKTNKEGYFVGNSLTYVDIAVWHTLVAAESQFPETYTEITKSIPTLVQFKNKIGSIPRIQAYLASDRRGTFEGNSMM
eukprot:gene33228-42966_t